MKGNADSCFFASKIHLSQHWKKLKGRLTGCFGSLYTPVWCTAACHWSAGCAGPLTVTCSSWCLYRDAIKVSLPCKRRGGRSRGTSVRVSLCRATHVKSISAASQTGKPACLCTDSFKGLVLLANAWKLWCSTAVPLTTNRNTTKTERHFDSFMLPMGGKPNTIEKGQPLSLFKRKHTSQSMLSEWRRHLNYAHI